MRLLFILLAFILSACASSPSVQNNPRIERLPESSTPAPLTAEEKAKLTELNARILREQEQKIADERERVLRERMLQYQRDYLYWPHPYLYGWGPHGGWGWGWNWGFGYPGWYW